MDPGAILERVLDEPRVAYVREVLDTYGRAAGGLLANGLAFTALFAVIPIALVTLGLAGLLASDPATQAALADALAEVFPPLADLIEGALEAVTSGAAVTSIVGLIGLFWTVSQFYVTLDVAFSRLFSDVPERDVFRRTARGFVWVGVLLALVVALVIAGTLLGAGAALLPGELPLGRQIATALTSWPGLFLAATGLVAIIYRFVPPRSPAWAAVLVPAIVVAVVIVLLSQTFAFLAPRLVGVAALAGSLATAFIALAWLSFTFQALLYGAAWVRVRDDRRRGAASSALASAAASAEPGGGGE
jgi:YihY family inner membrane protein